MDSKYYINIVLDRVNRDTEEHEERYFCYREDQKEKVSKRDVGDVRHLV